MQQVKTFLGQVWAKYAHLRTVLLGLSTLQAKLVALHPTTPNSVRIVSGALFAINMILWYLRGPHVDVTPSAPGSAPVAAAAPAQDGGFTAPPIPDGTLPPDPPVDQAP